MDLLRFLLRLPFTLIKCVLRTLAFMLSLLSRAFNQTLPAEERLRRLAEQDDRTKNVSRTMPELSVGQYLRQLQTFYALTTAPAGEKLPDAQTESPHHD